MAGMAATACSPRITNFLYTFRFSFRFSLLNSLFESHSCIRVHCFVFMSVYMYVYVFVVMYEYIVTLVLSTLRKNELLFSILQIYDIFSFFSCDSYLPHIFFRYIR